MKNWEGDELSLEESLAKLNAALEAGQYNSVSLQGAALRVQDHDDLQNKYLTTGARFDLSKKANQIIVVEDGEDGRKIFQALYLSCVLKTGNEELGVQAIARILNDLSQQGLIHSCLAPLSSLQLAMTSSVAKSVVFAFPIVPQNCIKDCEVKYKGFFTLEGGVGQDLEDTTLQLADGEFCTEIYVSHQLTMLQGQSTDKILQNQIEQYLALLPKGTEVRKVTQLAIASLAVPHEVIFFNPLLKKVKKVDLDYVRDCEMVNDKLEQFNLLTGIRYYGKDGKQLFNHQY